MSLNTFAYDGQIRRFLLQFIRAFSHFQVEFGKDSNGNQTLQQVPVIYGDSSAQAASIIIGNTENTTPTVPCIACYITGLDYDRARVQEPYHVSKLNIRERTYDQVTGEWGQSQGGAFTVERMMPVPYKLTLKVDIWTSNTTQKLQLLEQILPLFNPALEIQSTDNYIDWTSLSSIFLMNTGWTSRTIPTGGAGPQIDIFTVGFELPIWLSLPAKVKQLGVIQRIISSVFDTNGDLSQDLTDLSTTALMTRLVLTPLEYGLIYNSGMLQLTRKVDKIIDTADGPIAYLTEAFSWHRLSEIYGRVLQGGISTVRLEQPNGSILIGTVAYHPTDASRLLFSPIPDTYPANNLAPINAIIDPYNMPVDPTFISATAGSRYLILNDIGSYDNLESAKAWRGSSNTNLVARSNDIIEFDGNNWAVAFTAADAVEVKYLTNLKTGLQFKWTPETQEWTRSIEGKYDGGSWSIVL